MESEDRKRIEIWKGCTKSGWGTLLKGVWLVTVL